ncbi:hypothetical protein DFH28DRAFT_1220141 [Melampsora americana]|nr:hypothetical protein DFH28DRAFT_1220141 [Melampsora americana]
MLSGSNIKTNSNRLFLCLLLLPLFTLAHSFILAIEGIIKEEEIQTGAVTPCGRISVGDGKKGFVVNVREEFQRAEHDGLPLAGHDGSVVMSVFVHNRDSAGPLVCEYSTDLTMKYLKPMNIIHQIKSDKSTNEASKDFAYPLTSVFPPEAVCSAGKQKDACVIRCVDAKGFSSCAAVRLSRQTSSNNINDRVPKKEEISVHPSPMKALNTLITNSADPNPKVSNNQINKPPITPAKNNKLFNQFRQPKYTGIPTDKPHNGSEADGDPDETDEYPNESHKHPDDPSGYASGDFV